MNENVVKIMTRKIKTTPIGTGLAIHLPNAWVEANGIVPHSRLRLDILSDSSLLIRQED